MIRLIPTSHRRCLIHALVLLGLTQAPGARAAQTQSDSGVPVPIFRAGAAASNITPQLGVILDGAIQQNGPATHVHDELHARCLALDDGTTRIAFVICDTTMIAAEVIARAKRLVHEATGLTPDHVVITATHSHSTPRALNLQLGPPNDRYNDFFAQRIADGVRRALNNLQPAQIGWGSGQKPEYLQNRRSYVAPENILPTPFGTKGDQVVMNAAPALRLRPAGPVDPEVYVLSVRHRDGRPLAVLADYGLHYVGGIRRGNISADYYGVFGDELPRLLKADQQDPPFVALLANGTSGDVKTSDAPGPGTTALAGQPNATRMQEVARGIAREVQRVCDNIEYKQWVRLAVVVSQLELAVRKPDATRLAWAKQTLGKAQTLSPLTRPQIYAREALFLADYPPTVSITVQAFRIGDLGIATIPCEVFAETGLAIKKGSPFKATFIMELANGYYGYLPTPEQHQLGGYETWPARSAFLEQQAEPKIRAEALRLLANLADHRQ